METALTFYDPSNGERIGQVQTTALEAVPEVVVRARRATKTWKSMDMDRRLAMPQKAYAQVESRNVKIHCPE